jgi:hypothetical protein
MTLMGVALGTAVLVGLLSAGCRGGSQQNDASAPPAAVAPPVASLQDIGITFKTDPDPLKVGENTFEAMVMAGGQPVTDAGVSVELVMPAMPSMKMPEMRSTLALKHDGSGRYRGTGNMAMAGAWDATVKVTRSGQDIGSRKFPVTAK